MGKRTKINDVGITLPVLSSVLYHTLEDDVYVDGRSFELLLEIQRTLGAFEPIGDDEARMIGLEIPRGEAEDGEFPYEKEWFFLVTSTYRENTFLKISDRDHRYVIFTNRHFRDEARPKDMVWFMEPLLRMVKERRLQVEDREHCIEVMRELIRREDMYESKKGDWERLGVPAPFEKMTIREFCKYYRVADIAFLSRGEDRSVGTEDDVEYYTRHGLHGQLDEYDLKSSRY